MQALSDFMPYFHWQQVQARVSNSSARAARFCRPVTVFPTIREQSEGEDCCSQDYPSDYSNSLKQTACWGPGGSQPSPSLRWS